MATNNLNPYGNYFYHRNSLSINVIRELNNSIINNFPRRKIINILLCTGEETFLFYKWWDQIVSQSVEAASSTFQLQLFRAVTQASLDAIPNLKIPVIMQFIKVLFVILFFF